MTDPVVEMRALINAHQDLLVAASSSQPFVDLAAARDITARLHRILDKWSTLTDTERALVEGAITYVVQEDDEEHDLKSPIGLVDDEERVTALERALSAGE